MSYFSLKLTGGHPVRPADVSLSVQPAELLKTRHDVVRTETTGVARLSFNFVSALSSGQMAERRLQSLAVQLT